MSPIPTAQGTARLVAQPKPGKLDHGGAHQRIAGLADPLITIHTTASERAWGQTGKGRDLPPIVERSIEDFAGQHGCDLRPDTLELHQGGDGWPRLARDDDCRISFALDLGDLTKDQFQPIELTAELALEARGQGSPSAVLSSARWARRSVASG